MKALKLLTAGSMTALLAACASGPTVKSDYDHQADFAQYRTFGYMTPLGTDKAGYNTLLTERLKSATRGQMEMRGYTYSATNPDLLVNFGAKLQQQTEVVPGPAPMGPYYGYRAGFYGGWPGYGWGDDVYQYTEGTLSIDLVDARRRQLVWEGVAVGEIQNPSSAGSSENVDKVVAEVFAKYPFRAGVAAPQVPDKTKR
ncbi:DUF4136 domain-containing protein [Achromobacter sp. NFACC18-2]|uniref:DUF4136 domain-containing protein n=1 Tax=Achromobacter sp. NFACC18-2 TaxID=1564112 RepID=UPI0008CA6A1F|nr:DUF4136 domain-containing protein [Achromobacter sp. NFACC18-2]SEJ88884.1 protein of unknown function [Achromobacter sp. NFACC18-2]